MPKVMVHFRRTLKHSEIEWPSKCNDDAIVKAERLAALARINQVTDETLRADLPQRAGFV